MSAAIYKPERLIFDYGDGEFYQVDTFSTSGGKEYIAIAETVVIAGVRKSRASGSNQQIAAYNAIKELRERV